MQRALAFNDGGAGFGAPAAEPASKNAAAKHVLLMGLVFGSPAFEVPLAYLSICFRLVFV
jgi:hypothetical protein